MNTLFPIDLEGYFPLEVVLSDEESFLKIRETLTRIGIASHKTKKLFQSCNLLFKAQKYYIVHFKELFALDGKATDISTSDIQRRNTIAHLLEDWGLLTIINPIQHENCSPISTIKIISYRDKGEWELVEKYKIGKYKRSAYAP